MASKKSNPATMRDVARAAGVSNAAVSYHLNGTARLLPATGRRIDKAIRALGYRPNLLARSLSLGTKEAIGLVALVGSRPYENLVLAEIMGGVAEKAAEVDWSIQYIPIREQDVKGTWPVRHLDAVSGTLIMDWAGVYAPWSDIQKCRHPVVLANAHRKGVPSIEIDNEQGGRLVAEHLLALGHARVVILGTSGAIEKQRIAGAEKAFRKHGVRPEVILVESSAERTREMMRRIYARELRLHPTALFAVSDWIAMAAMDEARLLRVSVPYELSVVGYDDSLLAETASPPLATIRQPLREVGRAAFAELLRQLKGARPTSRRLPVEFVERASVRRIPGFTGGE